MRKKENVSIEIINNYKELYLSKSSKEIEQILGIKYSRVYYVLKQNCPEIIKNL